MDSFTSLGCNILHGGGGGVARTIWKNDKILCLKGKKNDRWKKWVNPGAVEADAGNWRITVELTHDTLAHVTRYGGKTGV